MRRQVVYILILICIAFNTSAQLISENELIGTWKVSQATSISKIPEDKNAETQSIINAFLKSTFEFKADKKCKFLFDFEEMEIINGYWKLDSSKNKITIREQDNKNVDNGILMEIQISTEQSKIYFQIAETPLKLEMKKE